MKTYLINLAKNEDRFFFMDAQLKRLGISYERFDAVYGKNLTTDELARKYHKWRAICIHGVALTEGRIGCALSHLGVYRAFLESGDSVALILEDDIIIDEQFPHVMEKAYAFINPEKPQVILFSAWNVANGHQDGIVAAPTATCADAYLITLPAAKIILRQNFPVVTIADYWKRWVKRYGLELYRAFPTTVRQDNKNFGTDIDTWTSPNMQRQVGHSLIAALGWKIFRCAGLFIDWVIWRVTVK